MRDPTTALRRPDFDSVDREFQRELNQRVSSYFREYGLSPRATPLLKLKAVLLYATFFGLFASFFWLPQNSLTVFATSSLIAFVLFLIGMNVMHDCAHGTLFKRPWLTKLGTCTWDFFGVSGDVYRAKHLDVHHKFTNITGWDGDMDLSYPVLRLNPNRPLLPRHRNQALYAPVLYSLVTLSWIFAADFAAIKSLRVCNFELKPFSRMTVFKIVAFKCANLAIFVGLPSLYFPFVNVLLTFIYVQLLLGFSLSLIFQVAHINEKAKFVLSESGQINEDWSVHQLATSTNFATENRFWRFALGGLNFQIEHHLFPAISHAHYPAMSRIVRDVCKEKNLPYNEYPTFRAAVASHFRLLKRLGSS